MRSPEIEALIDEHGGDRGVWGEHPEHPVSDWAAEAYDDNTRLGYWEWVEACIDNGED